MRRILAIGGLTPPRADRLLGHLVALSAAARPRIGFLPTAMGDAEATVSRFYDTFAGHDCELAHLGLFGRVPDPAAFVREQDVILVAGGNTRSLLALWREWGIDSLLRDALAAGTLLAGFSAGAICWFEHGVSDAHAHALVPWPGLGLLPGSCCPHYDGEAARRPAYHRLIEAGEIAPGIAIDDDCAVLFEDGQPRRVIAARADARAYRVDVRAGRVVEEDLVDGPREELAVG